MSQRRYFVPSRARLTRRTTPRRGNQGHIDLYISSSLIAQENVPDVACGPQHPDKKEEYYLDRINAVYHRMLPQQLAEICLAVPSTTTAGAAKRTSALHFRERAAMSIQTQGSCWGEVMKHLDGSTHIAQYRSHSAFVCSMHAFEVIIHP